MATRDYTVDGAEITPRPWTLPAFIGFPSILLEQPDALALLEASISRNR
jgi:hypothetical protein